MSSEPMTDWDRIWSLSEWYDGCLLADPDHIKRETRWLIKWAIAQCHKSERQDKEMAELYAGLRKAVELAEKALVELQKAGVAGGC